MICRLLQILFPVLFHINILFYFKLCIISGQVTGYIIIRYAIRFSRAYYILTIELTFLIYENTNKERLQRHRDIDEVIELWKTYSIRYA